MQRAGTRRAIAGVTILELMVTLAVLAVISAIGIPAMQNLISNNRVTSQANELVAMIYLARSESIRRHGSVDVVLDAGTNSWSGLVVDPEGDGSESCTAAGALRCIDHDRVALDDTGDEALDSLTITFNNRGYLDPFSEVGLYLTHESCSGASQRRLVTIRPTGQIETCAIGCDATTTSCP